MTGNERKRAILEKIEESKGKDFSIEAIKFKSVEEALSRTLPEVLEIFKKDIDKCNRL